MSATASLKLPIPGVHGRSGPHLQTFQAYCPPSQIIAVLGHDPRSTNWRNLPAPLREAYEEYQRKTKATRAETIYDYIGARMSPDAKFVGAFPSLSIGLTETPYFEPLHSRAGVSVIGVPLAENLGTLYIDMGTRHIHMLLDGLARFTGAMQYIDKGVDLDSWFSFAVTIFAPTPERDKLTPSELGQLFFDFIDPAWVHLS